MHRKRLLLSIIISIFLLFILTPFLYQCTLNEDDRFETYTDTLFRQEVSNNAITLHYTLKNSLSFHIYDTPTTLGQVSTDTDALGAAAENALATLHTYRRERLSSENQLTYDLLENNFSLSKEIAQYTLYEEPLSPLTGTQAQLPILLSEYQFYTVKDIDTYLLILKNLPEYFQAIIEFETAKSDAGLFMSEALAEAVIEECNAFVNMKNDNYLHHTFKNRISKLNLSEKEYTYYIEENQTIINDYVYPAYNALKSHLITLSKNGQNSNGLFYFPNGKKYYELLVNELTGSDRTIFELQTLTLSQIKKDLNDMQNALPNSETQINTEILTDSNPSSILISLKEKLGKNFPAPSETDISIKYVEESMEDFLSPAFYLTPAIDNSDENTIYINPKHMTDDLSLFTTLAHEGYPGHLYQTTYFTNTNPAPIRHLLSCGGYVEGWATYCEMMSYYLAPLPKETATFMQKNASITLGLYALADIGIHYEGWTLADTIKFFNHYGITDTDAVSEIFHLILGDPANYLKYYIGYIEFLEFKKAAIKNWGNEFSQERFHREILKLGPIPFHLLYQYMNLK